MFHEVLSYLAQYVSFPSPLVIIRNFVAGKEIMEDENHDFLLEYDNENVVDDLNILDNKM